MSKPLIETAREVVRMCRAGLCGGAGSGGAGNVCVEQAVYTALGLVKKDEEPSDHPRSCVDASVISNGISLNDQPWMSQESRGEGMARFAVAQLNTAEGKGHFDGNTYAKHFHRAFVRKALPIYLRLTQKNGSNEELASRCEQVREFKKAKMLVMEALHYGNNVIYTCGSSIFSALYDMFFHYPELSNSKEGDMILRATADAAVEGLIAAKACGVKLLGAIGLD